MPVPPSDTRIPGGFDLLQQCLPCGDGLTTGPLPCQYLPVAAESDQQAPACDPDPIDEDRMMNLRCWWQARFQLPAPGRLAAECAARRGPVDLGLGVLADQPTHEPCQLLPLSHVRAATDARGPARRAPPPLGPRGRLTVLDQPGPAYQTRGRIRGKVHEQASQTMTIPGLPRNHAVRSRTHPHVLAYNPHFTHFE